MSGALMGPLERGTRTRRPANFDAIPLPALPLGKGRANPLGKWVGLMVGMILGLALVAVLAHEERGMSVAACGAIVGGLSGILLTPFIAMFLFLAMLLMPWTLDGMLGDSVWTRISRSINERRWRPLLVPIVVCVVLPMAVCGFGASRTKEINRSMFVPAGLGAMVLGGMFGFIAGGRAAQAHGRAASAANGLQIQVAFLPRERQSSDWPARANDL